MIMAQEQAVLNGHVHLAEMGKLVWQAAQAGRPIHEVERGLWTTLLRLGQTMLADYEETVGPGDVGETLAHEGRLLRRLESTHDRRYVSVFGELTIPRYVYGTRETQKHEVVPTDALLGLPAGDFSNLLADWDQAFCVQGSYEQSRRTVERVLGIGQSVRSLEQMNRSMAGRVEAFRESQPTPRAESSPSITVLK